MLAMAMMLPLQSLNADPIPLDFQVNIYNPSNNHGQHRSPVPSVSIEGYTLYFNTPCDGCVLRIIGEGGVVEYSTVIPASCLSLVLPSDLSGEYELQIIQDGICYYTTINL